MIQWRMGLDLGGRWRNGSGDDASTDRGTATDSVTAGRAITDILDRYEERLDLETRNAAAEREARDAFRLEADLLLDQVVRPTLEAIGAEVLGRGHDWTVEERVDIQAQPALACLFRPAGASGAASELTFRCLFPDRVSATAVVNRGTVSQESPARSHLRSSMSSELVRKEVARFIRQVLDRPRS